MGWWGPSIFAGDAPLDALVALRHDLGVEIAEEDDRGYGDPDSWNEAALAAWAAKADGVEAWCLGRVDEERAAALLGAKAWLALMTLALGRRPAPEAFASGEIEAIRASLARCAEGFGSLVRKGDPSVAAVARACAAVDSALAGGPVPERAAVGVALDLHAMGGPGAKAGWQAAVGALSLAGAEVGDLPESCWETGFRGRLVAALPSLASAIGSAHDALETALPALTDDSAIDVQVAVSVIMGTGRPLSERMRELAGLSVLLDPWHGRDAGRDAVLAEFGRGVRDYRGEPWAQRNRSLGEAFGMAVEEGRSGPINVGPGSGR